MLENLPVASKKSMIKWLSDHWPTNQAQAIFKGFVSTIAESLKTDSHKAQDIFFSNHQATSAENQEKKKSRKAKAKDNFWIKVPWRNPELKDFALPTILNTKEIQDLYPSQEEIEKIKISYNLAPPVGITLMSMRSLRKIPAWTLPKNRGSTSTLRAHAKPSSPSIVSSSMAMSSRPIQVSLRTHASSPCGLRGGNTGCRHTLLAPYRAWRQG
jgi:hypothetical protein